MKQIVLNPEQDRTFRALLIRGRRLSANISSSTRDWSLEVYREAMQSLYDEINAWASQIAEIRPLLSCLSADLPHGNPTTFPNAVKVMISLLDDIEDIIQLQNPSQIQTEFFILPGQAFTASYILRDIFVSAKSSVKIIDNFMSEDSLLIIEQINSQRDVSILTKQLSARLSSAATRTKRGWKGKFEIRTTTAFHDRYLIIDETEVWMCGPSIDYLGIKKPGVIVKISDQFITQSIIDSFDREWVNAVTVI